MSSKQFIIATITLARFTAMRLFHIPSLFWLATVHAHAHGEELLTCTWKPKETPDYCFSWPLPTSAYFITGFEKCPLLINVGVAAKSGMTVQLTRNRPTSALGRTFVIVTELARGLMMLATILRMFIVGASYPWN